MLCAQKNKITSIKNISTEHLIHLDVNNNQIKDIEITAMPTLQYRNISKNLTKENDIEVQYKDLPNIERLIVPLNMEASLNGFETNFFYIFEGECLILEKIAEENND